MSTAQLINTGYKGQFVGNTTAGMSGSTASTSMTGHVRETIQVRLLDGPLEAQRLEFPGDRLVRLGWKGNTATGRVAHKARYVSVPVVSFALDGVDKAYLPMLQEAFEEAQKSLIHRAMSAVLDAGNDCTAIASADFGKDAVLADWMAGEDSTGNVRGGKLSKDIIEAWYSSTLADVIVVTLAERAVAAGKTVESDADLAPFQKAASNYGKVMMLLSSPKPSITVDQGKQLQKALELLPAEAARTDVVLGKILRKLDGVVNPVSEDNLLDLL